MNDHSPPTHPPTSAGSDQGSAAPVNRIRHTPPAFGGPSAAGAGGGAKPLKPQSEDGDSVAMAQGEGAEARREIRAFGNNRARHEDSWARTPNTTGQGAIHVRSFHCKLNEDALEYMDRSINEWLDAHPQYEVKFVSATIGTFTGKIKEPALICQVWV